MGKNLTESGTSDEVQGLDRDPTDLDTVRDSHLTEATGVTGRAQRVASSLFHTPQDAEARSVDKSPDGDT